MLKNTQKNYNPLLPVVKENKGFGLRKFFIMCFPLWYSVSGEVELLLPNTKNIGILQSIET